MATSSRYLQCTLHTLLAFHIGEIEVKAILVFIKLLTSIYKCRFKMRIAIKKTDNIRKIVHAIDIEIVDDCSLAGILARH